MRRLPAIQLLKATNGGFRRRRCMAVHLLAIINSQAGSRRACGKITLSHGQQIGLLTLVEN